MFDKRRKYREEQGCEQSLPSAPEKADKVGQDNHAHTQKGGQDPGRGDEQGEVLVIVQDNVPLPLGGKIQLLYPDIEKGIQFDGNMVGPVVIMHLKVAVQGALESLFKDKPLVRMQIAVGHAPSGTYNPQDQSQGE